MAKLISEIEEEDIPLIKEMVAKIRERSIADIRRLGGMTNHSCKVTLESGWELLVRVLGEGKEQIINRLDERKSTELCCNLGIDSDLYYFGCDEKLRILWHE